MARGKPREKKLLANGDSTMLNGKRVMSAIRKELEEINAPKHLIDHVATGEHLFWEEHEKEETKGMKPV